mgnify:CR=1 FL=1|jgi:hypothetical protein
MFLPIATHLVSRYVGEVGIEHPPSEEGARMSFAGGDTILAELVVICALTLPPDWFI